MDANDGVNHTDVSVKKLRNNKSAKTRVEAMFNHKKSQGS